MEHVEDIDSDDSATNSDNGHDRVRPQSPMPFDHQRCDNQNLHFTYAREAFASAHRAWSPTLMRELHITDDDGCYTNTGLLLSDESPYLLKCAIFDGDTKTIMLEHMVFDGSVLSLLNEGMAFLNEHNTTSTWPQTALREALVNAVLHRDYRYSGPTLITLFTQSIEIVSLGGLVAGLSINDLLNGICQPRNAWLADATSTIGLNNNFGTGIPRIMDSYAASAASPQLRVGPSSMAIILPKPVPTDIPWAPISDESHRAHHGKDRDTDLNNADGSATATRYVFPTAHQLFTDDPSRALTGARVIGVTPLQTLTLSRDAIEPHTMHKSENHSLRSLEAVTLHLFAGAGVELSRAQIERTLGITKNQAAYVLRNLVNSGVITRHGRSRATHYSLN